jgi:hypothetical protein
MEDVGEDEKFNKNVSTFHYSIALSFLSLPFRDFFNSPCKLCEMAGGGRKMCKRREREDLCLGSDRLIFVKWMEEEKREKEKLNNYQILFNALALSTADTHTIVVVPLLVPFILLSLALRFIAEWSNKNNAMPPTESSNALKNKYIRIMDLEKIINISALASFNTSHFGRTSFAHPNPPPPIPGTRSLSRLEILLNTESEQGSESR